MRRHPKARGYRVVARGRQIIVYECAGPDAERLAKELATFGFGDRITADSLRADFERRAQYAQVLRFTLAASQPATGPRAFRVERWCYRSNVNGWLDVNDWGDLSELVRRTVPTLSTDAFFELY